MIGDLVTQQALKEARAVLEQLRRARRYLELGAAGNAQNELRWAIDRLERGIRQAEQLGRRR